MGNVVLLPQPNCTSIVCGKTSPKHCEGIQTFNEVFPLCITIMKLKNCLVWDLDYI